MAMPLCIKRPVHCQEQGILLIRRPLYDNNTHHILVQVPRPVVMEENNPLIHKGEISFGAVLGLCTGYFIKKIGRLFALMVGLGFVFLQYMSLNGYVTVHWDRMSRGYAKGMGVGPDGKVTVRDVNSRWQKFVGFLTHNLQFKSTFLIGLYAGMRYG
ncbi:FUN14 family-domain-containing protein [Syncephalastrum racemosum]|uniref:FUN14 family-domain-containing protein n=1 Tax=Syncephalastrum racemosum TaxID=13706 RepID=A0A1X2H992_SYNRA|nr:FUN14 family-domain-containing protein [Syncephalastrum racemosum]